MLLCSDKSVVLLMHKFKIPPTQTHTKTSLLDERVVQLVFGERVIGTDHDGTAACEVSVRGKRERGRNNKMDNISQIARTC